MIEADFPQNNINFNFDENALIHKNESEISSRFVFYEDVRDFDSTLSFG